MCKNCIKSKRSCEGYNQRVVFKDPMGAQPGPYAASLFPNTTPYVGDALSSNHANKPPAPMPLQAIAPKPSAFDFNQAHMLPLHPAPGVQPHDFVHTQTSPTANSTMPNPLIAPTFPVGTPHHGFASGHALYLQRQPASAGESVLGLDRGPPISVSSRSLPSAGFSHGSESEYEDTLSDDDVYMAESDDEQPDPRALITPSSSRLLWPYSRSGTEVRTFSAFAQEQALSEYMDYAPTSELRNIAMRTVFMHFVSVTGPSMSLYERDPSPPEDPSQFEGNAELDHNLWSCKIKPLPPLSPLPPPFPASNGTGMQTRFQSCLSIIRAFYMPSWPLQVCR